MVEREQVVFPLRVDDIQNDASLQPAHKLAAKLFFLFLIASGDRPGGGIRKLVVIELPGVCASSFGIDAKLAVHLREKLRAIPLARMLFARAKRLDQLARNVFEIGRASCRE